MPGTCSGERTANCFGLNIGGKVIIYSRDELISDGTPGVLPDLLVLALVLLHRVEHHDQCRQDAGACRDHDRHVLNKCPFVVCQQLETLLRKCMGIADEEDDKSSRKFIQ